MPLAPQVVPSKVNALSNIALGSSSAAYNDATEQFAAVQSTEQTTNIAAKPDKVKTAKAEDNNVTVLNVVRDYDWTLSKNRGELIDTIPYIKMREFDIVSSNLATSLYASFGTVADAIAANKDALNSTGISTGASNLLDAISNKLGISEESKKTLGNAASKLTATISDVADVQLSKEKYGPEWSDDLKKTYSNLYLREATNIVYKLPYFTKEMARVSSSFERSSDAGSASMTSGMFSKAAENINSAITAMTTMPSLVEPGVYIERPQYFRFGGSAAALSFSFTLFNTITKDSYHKNSQLIKKLLIKNLPQRVNKVTVYPPAIYEVTIPGRAFYPYCYIDYLSITHEGTKRIINIDGGDEIVPDAYVVKIDIRSLTSDTNNFYVPQTGNAGIDLSTRRKSSDIDRITKAITNKITNLVDFKKSANNTQTPVSTTAKEPIPVPAPTVPGASSTGTSSPLPRSQFRAY